jgi:hypothetical protein
MMAALGGMSGSSAVADEVVALQFSRRVTAARAHEPAPLELRLTLPRAAIKADLKLLFAQNGQVSATDAIAGDDTILVRLDISVPRTVDDDIAKQHGLELIDRTELNALGWRVVRYRLPTNRLVPSIVAELRDDERILGVQGTVQYGLPIPKAPTTEISGLQEPPRGERQSHSTDLLRQRAERRRLAVKKDAAQPAKPAAAAEITGTHKSWRSDKGAGRVASGPAALRFPTADEPFMNVGVTGK